MLILPPCICRALQSAALVASAVVLPLTLSLHANDATLDPGFATHEIPAPGNEYGGVRSIAVQPDGKIMIGGDFNDNFFLNNIAGRQRNLARLLPNGHYDASFHFNDVDSLIGALVVLPDGKLLIGGFFDEVGNGALARSGIARLNGDGTPDASFGPAGTYARPGSNINVAAIVTQPDGKIMIGGAFRTTLSDGTTRDNVMRLNADGTADAGFTADANALVREVGALALQPDGKVLVGSNGGSLLARLNADGSLDASFHAPIINGNNFGRPNESVFAIIVLPDGKIVAGGQFVAVAGPQIGRASLARFNPDGSLDLGFDAGFNDYTTVRSMAAQADGKYVAGGYFSDLSGTHTGSIGRFNLDGSVDASFEVGAGPRDTGDQIALISAVAIQSDGKELVGGNIVSYDGLPRAGIARLAGGGAPPKFAELHGNMAGVKAGPNPKGTRLKVSGTLTVRNDGTRAAKDVQVAAYLSDDQTFSATADRLISVVSLTDAGIPKIGKNGKQVTLPVLFKAKLSDLGVTSGKYVLIVLDPANTIPETDETNNVVFVEQLP